VSALRRAHPRAGVKVAKAYSGWNLKGGIKLILAIIPFTKYLEVPK